MKKKLSMDLGELRVESFDTQGQHPLRGTVYGQEDDSDCYTYSCQGTCGASPPSHHNLEKEGAPTRLVLTVCAVCCV